MGIEIFVLSQSPPLDDETVTLQETVLGLCGCAAPTDDHFFTRAGLSQGESWARSVGTGPRVYHKIVVQHKDSIDIMFMVYESNIRYKRNMIMNK